MGQPEMYYKTTEVFGISRDLPLNYVERKHVDEALIDNLTRDKHVVIYGSSKQGKTSLRKHSLKEEDYVVVQCSNKWTIAELNAAILKQAGYEVTQSETRTVTGRNRILAKISGLIWGSGMELEGERENEKSDSVTKAPLELDPEDVNDIILALKGFDRFIVLEDFHYLDLETQKDFAVALKAYHEKSKLCFMIVGVWLEAGRLTVHNGDLTGRVVAINADRWHQDELSQVIKAGEQLLNIQFTDEFKREILRACYDSVYILQEACFKCLIKYNVHETQRNLEIIGTAEEAAELIREVVNEQSARYMSFVTHFASGFQQTALEMYKWLLLPVLSGEIQHLEAGLKLSEIRKLIQVNHPAGKINVGNVTQALQSCASLQVEKSIKPIILDYDQTNLKLSVVDRGFLIWLGTVNRDELLELADLPTLNEIKYPQ